MVQYRRVKGALWDADFGRYGWPEAVGGLGGPTMFRAIVGEEIASRELADPSIWTMIEVLAPTVSAFGSAGTRWPRWCRSCSAATNCGARGSPSPEPAATSRR